jgi:phospholipid transport system substrate-binding protein
MSNHFGVAAGRRAFVAGLALFAAASVAAVPWIAASANTSAAQARELIENLTRQALTILRTEKGDLAEREQKFRTVLTEYFAMQSISRRVAGKHWQSMSPDQQKEFMTLFSEWVLKTYSRRLGGYKGEEIAIEKASAVSDDTVLVQTRVSSEKRKNKVDWRVVAEDAGKPKIVDVSVDGVSMLVAQKSEVSSIIKNKGVDGLITTLRQHVK